MAVSKNTILPIITFTIFSSTEKIEIFLDNENVIYIFLIFILQTTTALRVHACFLSRMNVVLSTQYLKEHLQGMRAYRAFH